MLIKKAENIIFVCTSRNATALPTMLMSVLTQTLLPNEILIRLEGDPTGLSNFYVEQAIALARLKGVDVTLVPAKSKGVRHARQTLLNTAVLKGYEYMWMGDDDVFYESTYLQILRSHFHNDDNPFLVAWFSGFKADVSNIRGYADFNLDIHTKIKGKADPYNWIYECYDSNREYSIIQTLDTGACVFDLSLCKEAKFEIMDMHTNASGEDTVFALQLGAMGYKGMFIPAAAAWHLEKPGGGAYTEFAARGEMLLAMCDAHGWDKEVLKEYMPEIWKTL